MKRFLFLVVIAVAISAALTLVNTFLETPEAKDQQVIDDCWAESRGSALAPDQRQVVIGACQALEKAYLWNYGTKPRSASKEV